MDAKTRDFNALLAKEASRQLRFPSIGSMQSHMAGHSEEFCCFRPLLARTTVRAMLVLFVVAVWNGIAMARDVDDIQARWVLGATVMAMVFIFLRAMEIANAATGFVLDGHLPDQGFRSYLSLTKVLALLCEPVFLLGSLGLMFAKGLAYPFYAPSGWTVGSIATGLGCFVLAYIMMSAFYDLTVLEHGVFEGLLEPDEERRTALVGNR
jgi:hypothetical protein